MESSKSNKSISSIVDYIKSGEKHSSQQLLGVEVEHVIVDAKGNSVQYSSSDGRVSVRDIMSELAEYYNNVE